MSELNKNYKYILFIILALIYNLTYFHRVSTNAIVDDLIRDINLSATELGTMSSAYFIFYAVLQPLIGILTDKIGSKKVLITFISISIVGCISFGLVNDFTTAFLARSLIGIGMSGIFVPSMKLLSDWFGADKFARISGVYIGCGNLGAVIATIPLVYLATNYGWRNVFTIFAIVSFVFLFLIFIFVREIPPEMQTSKVNTVKIKTVDALKSIIKIKNFRLLFVIFFLTLGVLITFQGLWATKYLVTVMKITVQSANDIIIFIPFGFIAGAVLGGYLSDKVFHSRTIPFKIGSVITLICWIILTFFSSTIPKIPMMMLLFILTTAGGMLPPLIFATIKDIMPASIVGTSLGFINPACFFGIFVYQIITGYIIDMNKIGNEYTCDCLFPMMFFCLVTLIITTGLSFWLDETYQVPKTVK